MDNKLTFRLRDPTAMSPRDGFLRFWRATSPNAGYIQNSVIEKFDTGLALSVPAGITVEITPVPIREALGVYLEPFVLIGPQEVPQLLLSLHNLSNATVRLSPGDVIARITAVKTPAMIPWHEYEEPPPLREQEPAQVSAAA